MNERDNRLTLQEAEQLCRLYMDCRLSVFEEAELQYVLGKLPFSTPCIDEVRTIMGISGAVRPVGSLRKKRRSPFIRSPFFRAVAASLAIGLGIGLPLLSHHYEKEDEHIDVYIAYAGGEILDAEESAMQVEADMKRAEAFIDRMTELDAGEKKKVEYFMNHHIAKQ